MKLIQLLHRPETAMNEAGDRVADADKQAVQADLDALKATVAAIGENEQQMLRLKKKLRLEKKKLMKFCTAVILKMYEQTQGAGAQGAGPGMGAGAGNAR